MSNQQYDAYGNIIQQPYVQPQQQQLDTYGNIIQQPYTPPQGQPQQQGYIQPQPSQQQRYNVPPARQQQPLDAYGRPINQNQYNAPSQYNGVNRYNYPTTIHGRIDGNQQNNNVGTGINNRYSNDNLAHEPSAPKQQQQQEQVSNQQVQETNILNVPISGFEYMFLTLPTRECKIVYSSSGYLYNVVDKKESSVDYFEHASIYNSNDKFISNRDIDGIKVKYIDDLKVVDSYNSSIDDLVYESVNMEDDETFAREYIVSDKKLINKITTSESRFMYSDIINKCNNLSEIAAEFRKYIDGDKFINKIAFRKFNSNITSYINSVMNNVVIVNLKMGSFAEDIDELIAIVEDKDNKLRSSGKTNDRLISLAKSALEDCFQMLKNNTKDIEEYLFTDEKEENDLIGHTFMSSRVTAILSRNVNVKYELTDLNKGDIRVIKQEHVPVLHSLVSDVFNHSGYRNQAIIILDLDGTYYRVMSTKYEASTYSIEKIS